MVLIDETIFEVRVQREAVEFDLIDGRRVSVPLEHFPKLAVAGRQRCGEAVIAEGGRSVEWPAIGEAVSVEHVLSRRR